MAEDSGSDRYEVLAAGVLQHCQNIWTAWLDSAIAAGKDVQVDFDALAWQALKTMPPEVRPWSGAQDPELIVRQVFKDIYAIYLGLLDDPPD